MDKTLYVMFECNYMTKNKIIWLLSFILFLNSFYQIYANYNALYISYCIYCVLNFLCAIGLLLKKAWIKHYVYTLSALSIGGWLDSIIRIYRTGWPAETVQETITSLIPGLFLITGWILLIIYTFIFFKRVK